MSRKLLANLFFLSAHQPDSILYYNKIHAIIFFRLIHIPYLAIDFAAVNASSRYTHTSILITIKNGQLEERESMKNILRAIGREEGISHWRVLIRDGDMEEDWKDRIPIPEFLKFLEQ
ncbi:hypothetical protein MMC21_002342 [Puttea exsequens]|nr:hypothetical protein [Puttea exsequens]